MLLCVRRRTGGERAFVCVLPGAKRRCSLASLFVQGLGPSVGKQLSLVLTELAVFVCDVCDGCVANLGALLATQYRRARASSESEDDRPGRERRE